MAKLSLSELKKQISQLEAEVIRRTEETKQELRAEFDAKLAEASFTLADIYGDVLTSSPKQVKAARVTQSVDPKFRDPKTGSTWSGRGRAPQWVQAILAERKMSIEAFKVTSEFII